MKGTYEERLTQQFAFKVTFERGPRQVRKTDTVIGVSFETVYADAIATAQQQGIRLIGITETDAVFVLPARDPLPE